MNIKEVIPAPWKDGRQSLLHITKSYAQIVRIDRRTHSSLWKGKRWSFLYI